MSEQIVEINNVSFSYENELVLKNVNLEINKGDYLGIIGPNGGGKTTLLKIILGLLSPLEGEVKLFGTPIHQFKAWSKIGYVSQKATHIDQNFPMTVEGVVRMGRYGKKKPFHFLNADDEKKITQALQYVGMEENRMQLIGDLSGGQQQRVFIARVLAGEPELIVLDEPTAGIDAKTQEQLYELFKKMNREMHLTLILVSHDLDAVEREVSKLLCIDRTTIYCGLPDGFRMHTDYQTFHKGARIAAHH